MTWIDCFNLNLVVIGIPNLVVAFYEFACFMVAFMLSLLNVIDCYLLVGDFMFCL